MQIGDWAKVTLVRGLGMLGSTYEAEGKIIAIRSNGFFLLEMNQKLFSSAWQKNSPWSIGQSVTVQTLLQDQKFYYWFAASDVVFNWQQSPKAGPPGGMACCQCQEFYPYAEANLPGRLVCYSCRVSYGWKYPELSIGRK